jgi:Core-2/I-Branching enzyme
MKHGVLITAYNNLGHLHDLIKSFDSDFLIYIHLDKKSRISGGDVSELMKIPTVKLVSREYNVNWGSWNFLKCILLLCREALKEPDIAYLHLISGHDYPVKNMGNIKKFLEDNPGDYIDYFEVLKSEWKTEWMGRLSYYGLYDLLNTKSLLGRKIINGFILLQKKLRLVRSIPKELPTLYGGLGWWSLRRSSVGYIVDWTDKHPIFMERLRFTFAPDEIFFQTILLNAPFNDTGVNNNLRFSDWAIRNGNRPAILDETDFERIVNSDALFARKFDFPISTQLKQMIDDNILRS